MTTNILLGIGVIWFFAIAIVVELVVTVTVCKEIDKRISNGGLSFLVTCIVVATALATTVILVFSTTSFLSECFSEENVPGFFIVLIMFAALTAVIRITLQLKLWFEDEVDETGQSAKAAVDMSDENETEAAEKRVRDITDDGHYFIEHY